jgi:hypothetical protein
LRIVNKTLHEKPAAATHWSTRTLAAHLDNAHAESLFRTAKYRPEYPVKRFVDLEEARTWAAGFARWYNHDQRHSCIRYVSPAQRDTGEDHPSLAARHALYAWCSGTRW